MEKSAILQADILDIVFEGRNKEYGAYELRRTYNKRLRVSVAVMLSVTMLLCIGQLIAGREKPDNSRLVILPPDMNLEKAPDHETPPPPPPPPKTPPPQQVKTIHLATPKIMPDDEVKKDEMPEQDEIENAKIDLQTKDGIDDDNKAIPPPSDDQRGILTKPEPPKEDEIVLHVQIESSYPGGLEAWRRFLNRNLRYPEDAIEKGIQGMVMIQFIVDKEGNVSDVQAISGPMELRDEAIRVIKKSGKWTPAVQNGLNVKTYKKQPIGFSIQDQ